MKFALLSSIVTGVFGEIPVADVSRVHWDAVREDIRAIMNTPSWDDGSYAPFFIRLAWHSSGTYNKHDGTGGTNGATMRFPPESTDGANAGLDKARAKLEPIYEKHMHSGLTHADLYVLAAYVGLEMTNGPVLEFTGGRVDFNGKTSPIENGRLPDPEAGLEDGMKVDDLGRLAGWERNADHIRSIFGRMGFSDEEMVALIAGGHAYGRCHKEFTGYEGNWMQNPIYFSNEYVKDLINDEWRAIDESTKVPEAYPYNDGFAPEDIRPKGKRQYVDINAMNPYAFSLAGMRDDDTVDDSVVSVGEYFVNTTWMNVRATADSESDLLARVPTNTTFNVVEIQEPGPEGGSVRALALEGGWISLALRDGTSYFGRRGDLDMRKLAGTYRMRVGEHAGKDFECRRVTRSDDGTMSCELRGHHSKELFHDHHGHHHDDHWVTLYSPQDGLVAEHVEADYNEQGSRVPLRDLYGHQMMLVSDMVLKWDPVFRKQLDVYLEDSHQLKEDFGKAYKRLTELGCAWSADKPESALVV